MSIIRRIRDNIHGTISISELEDRVIAHPFMQRLRRIKQLAFLQYVFPGASHSRFEHSLGVLHMARVAWNQLRENQMHLRATTQKYKDFAHQESQVTSKNGAPTFGLLAPTFALHKEIFEDEYVEQALRLAALMHDIGHSPYSHSGEIFMPTWQQFFEVRHRYADYLSDYIEGMIENFQTKGRASDAIKVRHELYTLLMAHEVLTSIYNQNEYRGLRVDPQDVAAIIAPSITPVAGSPLAKYGLHQLCHELVSGEFDVDRMDYLLRDSRECGVVYGIFDESRILNSLALYWDPVQRGLHLAIQFSGLAAFEDYLRARHSMYLQLYFHKTSVAAEAMFKRLATLAGRCHLPLDVKSYASIDETNFQAFIIEAAKQSEQPEINLDLMAQLMEQLLLERRLWKRVYEVASNIGPSDGIESIQHAATIIASLGFEFEKVSSSSSLTRFRPRAGDQPGATLRLIKKDHLQFPRVIPIEDQLSLIDSNAHVHITRLYVENKKARDSERAIADVVREALYSS